MFTRLPESNARPQRRMGGLVVSTGAHLVIIALAVRATGLTAAPRPKTEVLPTPIYVAPRPAPKDVEPPPPRRLMNPDASVASVPNPRDVVPVITTDIPNVIPEAGSMSNLMAPAFDATRVSETGTGNGSPNVAAGAPFTDSMVEKVVVAIPGTASPRYPSMLQRAGIEGDVRAQFVVDTLGRVETGSVRIVESGHDQFAAAVRDALLHARFKPAEAGGHKVRQLVEQTFTFRIEH